MRMLSQFRLLSDKTIKHVVHGARPRDGSRGLMGSEQGAQLLLLPSSAAMPMCQAINPSAVITSVRT